MIEEQAMVVGVEGDEAWVESSRRSSCGSCSAKGCGTGALSQVLGGRVLRMRVSNPVAAKKGDQVVLGVSESALLKGSLAVYLVPLLALFVGGLLGELLAGYWQLRSEGVTIICALVALFISLRWLQGFNRRAAHDSHYQAEILRIVNSTGDVGVPFNLNK